MEYKLTRTQLFAEATRLLTLRGKGVDRLVRRFLEREAAGLTMVTIPVPPEATPVHLALVFNIVESAVARVKADWQETAPLALANLLAHVLEAPTVTSNPTVIGINVRLPSVDFSSECSSNLRAYLRLFESVLDIEVEYSTSFMHHAKNLRAHHFDRVKWDYGFEYRFSSYVRKVAISASELTEIEVSMLEYEEGLETIAAKVVADQVPSYEVQDEVHAILMPLYHAMQHAKPAHLALAA